jgi:hypothetical protein
MNHAVVNPQFYRPETLLRHSTLPPPERCPECATRLAPIKGARVCLLCARTITRHEKFIFTPIGVRHRNCADPESYSPVAPALSAQPVNGIGDCNG